MSLARFQPSLTTLAALSTLYSQPHRHYHDLSHIHSLITEFERVLPHVASVARVNGESLMQMIWFHDAYYDPYAPQGFNEATSAGIFEQHYHSMEFRSPFYPDVVGGILMSALHTCDQIDDNTYHADGLRANFTQQLFLDLDLHGLGLPYDQYYINSELIALEYPRTLAKDFDAGRVKFLKAMLARKRIYYTDYMHGEYEVQARSNMQQELDMLEAG